MLTSGADTGTMPDKGDSAKSFTGETSCEWGRWRAGTGTGEAKHVRDKKAIETPIRLEEFYDYHLAGMFKYHFMK